MLLTCWCGRKNTLTAWDCMHLDVGEEFRANYPVWCDRLCIQEKMNDPRLSRNRSNPLRWRTFTKGLLNQTFSPSSTANHAEVGCRDVNYGDFSESPVDSKSGWIAWSGWKILLVTKVKSSWSMWNLLLAQGPKAKIHWSSLGWNVKQCKKSMDVMPISNTCIKMLKNWNCKS